MFEKNVYWGSIMKLKFFFMVMVCVLLFVGCKADKVKEFKTMTVTSNSINSDGKLLTVTVPTTNKPSGENKSPQLSWDAVEGAECYAIYMIDEGAGNWLHWIATGIKTTSVEQGAEIENSKYIGPYPPSGQEHSYKIIVYALKSEADEYKGSFNSINRGIEPIEATLDVANGKSGNILAKGYIVGTYKAGETNE